MAAYNAERYVGKAIESILNQTFVDFEFIIIDDCSTDKTWEIVQKYAKREARIVAAKNEKNLGIAGNRNKLISLARGRYIAWQDVDDISLPKRIEHEYLFMEKNPDVGIVGGFLEIFNENGIVGIRNYKSEDKDLRKTIFRYSPVAQPAAMIRKKCFDEFGLYNSRYFSTEDLDMSFRIGTKYKFANLQEIVIKYRENYNSASLKRLKAAEKSTLKIRLMYSKDPHYNSVFIDYIYNTLHFFSIFIIPSKIKVKLFNFYRNKGKSKTRSYKEGDSF